MLTRRELYTLDYGTMLIGPNNTFGRYLRGCSYVRGRPTRVELGVGPNGAIESWDVYDLLEDWSIASEAQAETINLLFNPFDDAF